MKLATQLKSLRIETRNLTLVERAELCCRVAKQLEQAGEYEGAREALDEFWPEGHQQPKLQGLDRERTAKILLRVGALAGWLGSERQAEGSQETAKDLITQSVAIFEELGQAEGLAEAHADLAVCYWREGSFDEARINLETAFAKLPKGNSELKAVIRIRAAMVEVAAHRLSEALRILNESVPLLEQTSDHAFKGKFHNLFAVLFRRLAKVENRDDYMDRALIEYAAASFHFEQAGHTRFQGCVDINLGFLFFTLGRFAESHEHLDRARNLFLEIGDSLHLAQVNDTRARALLAEDRLIEAERFARSAVKTLEKGDEQALLAEALTTYGVVLARTGRQPSARIRLDHAIEVAETAGDLEGAGRAQLTVIEELGGQTSTKDMISIYLSAINFLKRSQDPSAAKRLISCSAMLLDTLGRLEPEGRESPKYTWEGFSFTQYVREAEGTVIERALKDAGGSVTRAARLLGTSHQTLIYLIKTRHKKLLNARSTVRKRRRHLFSEPRKIKTRVVGSVPSSETSQISILHVDDNELVARMIADTLVAEGMHVDSCINGTTALKLLKGNSHYDVIIVDNDLPGLNGLELARRTRSIAHRRGTPIIMLSGSDCEREAWRVGVDAFLRKPEAIDQVSSTIARVLKEREEKSD